ncbi:MAG TPA: hypothetical protein ACQGQJ_06300 [Xylella fastidiosa subsp. multiplex]
MSNTPPPKCPSPNTARNTLALHQHIPNRTDFYPHTDAARQYIVLPQTFKPPPTPPIPAINPQRRTPYYVTTDPITGTTTSDTPSLHTTAPPKKRIKPDAKTITHPKQNTSNLLKKD